MSDPANRNGIASTNSVATSTEGVQLLVSETNSFMSDFGLVSVQLDRTRSLLRCDLTDKLRSRAGTAPVGLQATVMDFVTSDPALVAAAPDWTATQDLSLHGAGWVTVGPIVVDSTLVRVGKKVVVVAADVYDGNGCEDLHELAAAIDAADPRSRPTLAARGLVTFARLPRAAAHGADEYTPDRWIGQIRSRPMVPIEDALYPRLGIRVIDAARGELELDRTPFVANQIGTIMGGVQALLAEYAANAMRPELVASDIQMNFLAQVRVGPARTYGTVIRDDADHSVVSVRLVDAGADEMILALATVTLRKPPAHR